jgi:hypothetical protein
VHEYASGRSGGVEAVAHTVRCHADRGALVLQMDFKNAFGALSRQAMLAAVCKHVPELLPLVLFMYGQPTPTIFGGELGQPELRVMQEEDDWVPGLVGALAQPALVGLAALAQVNTTSITQAPMRKLQSAACREQAMAAQQRVADSMPTAGRIP